VRFTDVRASYPRWRARPRRAVAFDVSNFQEPASKRAMVKRRTFIVGGAAALGALVVGWSALPPRQRLMPAQPLDVQPSQTALNGWVKIAADNRITVMVCRAEMGQGVHTGLA